MTTLIMFNSATGTWCQAFVNEEVVKSILALVPHDMVLKFIIQDEVDVLDINEEPIEELAL